MNIISTFAHVNVMNLAVDIGNTKTKMGLFKGSKLLWNYTVAEISPKIISGLIEKSPVERAIISDVADKSNAGKAFTKIPSVIYLSGKTPVPFVNKYKTPSTLGTDRMALVAGALKYFPGKNVLVVSMGTCVTYDFINSRSEYLGGSISPGMEMRFTALSTFTARLPMVKPKQVKALIGRTTEESIRTGVISGILHEVDGFIMQYRKEYPALKVILTGGDAPLFAGRIKSSIFALPELSLTGLNEILLHNSR
jgi:type III pantothenate kinase